MNKNGGMVKKWEPNIVPLCDILLIIMIIFMVIAPGFNKSMDICLPGLVESYPIRTGLVVIDKDTSITFNRKPVTIEKLSETLSDYYNGRVNKSVYVCANKHLAYKHVVKLIDVIKAAGINQVLLSTSLYDSSH